MEQPLQLQFRNLEHSPAIEAAVRKHVDKLKFFNGDIISCRVAIESPHKHQYKGKLYHVVVDVRVPGKEIVVSRAPDDQQAHEDERLGPRSQEVPPVSADPRPRSACRAAAVLGVLVQRRRGRGGCRGLGNGRGTAAPAAAWAKPESLGSHFKIVFFHFAHRASQHPKKS